jgi:hypothetical protein
MLGWDEYGLDKKCIGTRYVEHMFLHPVGSVGHVVYSCASRAQNGDTLFFMLGLDWYGSDKKSDGTRYAKLVFLHPIGSAGHVVHSDAPEARNGDALFFMLGWDRYRFNKKNASRHVTPNLCFYIRWDLESHSASGASGA